MTRVGEKNMMIVLLDNYDRPGSVPVVIQKNLSKRDAESMAERLNNMTDAYGPAYYMAVEDGWNNL